MVGKTLQISGSQSAAVYQHDLPGDGLEGRPEVVPGFDRHDRAGSWIDLLAEKDLKIVNLYVMGGQQHPYPAGAKNGGGAHG